jgi:hypothetical protein
VQRLLINQRPDTGHAVGAVGDRDRQISEDPAGVVHQGVGKVDFMR